MIDWAAALQRAGIQTGVLSNVGDAMEAGIVARFPWLAKFNHRTFSHRLGMAKPDAAIYRHAAEGLGVAADEILFVDDLEENVAAARAAGNERYSVHRPRRLPAADAGSGIQRAYRAVACARSMGTRSTISMPKPCSAGMCVG
jgi:FMN phosphatase YigB (HAD superfamily)